MQRRKVLIIGFFFLFISIFIGLYITPPHTPQDQWIKTNTRTIPTASSSTSVLLTSPSSTPTTIPTSAPTSKPISMPIASTQPFAGFANTPSTCSLCDYTQGQWIETNTTETFHQCCGWDGQFHNGPTCGLPYGLTTSGGHACGCHVRTNPANDSYPLPQEHFQFQFICKDVPTFSAVNFCTMLDNRQFHFVGDSITQQTYSMFRNLLAVDLTAITNPVVTTQLQTCMKNHVFTHSDTLVGKNFGVGNRGARLSHIDFSNQTILLLNVGNHLVHGTNHTLYFNLLDKELTIVKQRTPDMKILWRNSYTAHEKCTQYTKPLESYADYNELFGGIGATIPATKKYNWMDFLKMNEMARRVLGNHVDYFIDVKPLELRPDGHPAPDCNHWCLPGALNVMGRIIMYHFQACEI